MYFHFVIELALASREAGAGSEVGVVHWRLCMSSLHFEVLEQCMYGPKCLCMNMSRYEEAVFGGGTIPVACNYC